MKKIIILLISIGLFASTAHVNGMYLKNVPKRSPFLPLSVKGLRERLENVYRKKKILEENRRQIRCVKFVWVHDLMSQWYGTKMLRDKISDCLIKAIKIGKQKHYLLNEIKRLLNEIKRSSKE